MLDFSANTNPFGPPPGVREAVAQVDIAQYPDSGATELRRSLARSLNIFPDNIIVGSGSTELLRLIAMAYLERDDVAMVMEPTFGEYEAACCVVGAKVVKDVVKADGGFQIEAGRVVSLIEQHSPKAVFLCNPNNPTGRYLSREDVEQILGFAENSLVVLDEAYVSFVDEPWSSVDMIARDNLLILRSMTKDFALAGLRLGYAFGHSEIIDALKRVCPPWNVNAAALRAGTVALESGDYVDRCATQLKEAKRYLIDELSQLDYRILPSRANFFLMEVGDAVLFRQTLLRYGILVRDCTSFGLPQYVRIAPRTMDECQKLVQAIAIETKARCK
jgi:histidinol-phosphate aminotransferase